MDWNNLPNDDNNEDDVNGPPPPPPSPVERRIVRDRIVYIKRDDRLSLHGSNVSGNKARKFAALNSIPAADFPECLVSYGGPQSNAMAALAAVVSSKNSELGYVDDDDYEDGNYEDGGYDEDDGDEEEMELSDFEDVFGPLDSETGEEAEPAPAATAAATQQQTPPISPPTLPKRRFVYHTKKLPRYLRNQPSGNLLRATALGMELETTLTHESYRDLFGGLHGGSVMAPADLDPPVPGRSLWIPQGGASGASEMGVRTLAREIYDFWETNGRGEPLAVCVPGGTCATAFLLHRSLNEIIGSGGSNNDGKMDVRVVVIPCVGDDAYAERQMSSLAKALGGGKTANLPAVLRPRSGITYGSAMRRRNSGYFSFGEPSRAILDAYDEMRDYGVILDLLYGAPAWSLLLQHWKSGSSSGSDNDDDDGEEEDGSPIAGRHVMYVHSGGLEGVASQLTRYKHKGLLDAGKTV